MTRFVMPKIKGDTLINMLKEKIESNSYLIFETFTLDLWMLLKSFIRKV